MFVIDKIQKDENVINLIIYKKMLSKNEIEILKKNAKVHRLIFEEIKKNSKKWTKAIDIDKLCYQISKQNWVLCWFKWVYNFPANICISINDVVVHWLPKEWLIFNDWDLVTFDFWIKDKEIWINTDAAFSIIIWGEEKNPIWAKLIEANKKALYAWIKKAKVWNTIWDISYAIWTEIEKAWFKIVKQLTWHCIWKKLHEKPYIPNYWKPWTWAKLKKWMLLAIEPILWETSWEIIEKWSWEIYIKDWSLWCQYEHTVLITDSEAEIII